MKIFGLNFGSNKQLTDNVSTKDIVVSDITSDDDENDIPTPEVATVKKIHSPALIFQHMGMRATKPSQKRHFFEPAEYDLYEIGRIEDVDSYVRQAFKKKIGLFLKEGFDYVGKNKKIVKYIKTRFAQIERATGIPHQEFIRRLASQLIRKSNAFLIKVRSETASGGAVRVDANGKTIKPVAGYFFVPPETMQIKSDGSGEAYLWRQLLPNGVFLLFDPQDVIHFTFDKKEGFLFGTPTIVPVIDDIRALRTIEENIELLIYKHLFPLFHFVVGTDEQPAGITEDGRREVEVFRQEIQMMPSEGGLVTSERFKIDSIGSESKALRAESYIEHFKQRVFSGLGMSAVDFGEADTSNRSTADNMSRALIDDIKDYQDSFEAQFNSFIISELLLEANFGEDVLDDENKVELSFREIDIDKQIKVENHAADLFTKHGITWDELRIEVGRDPVEVPDDPEHQDPAKYPQWFGTFWKLFDEPKAMIAAKQDPYSPFSKALAENPSSALTSEHIGSAQQEKQQGDVALAKAKAVTKKVAKKDNFLAIEYLTTQEVVATEYSKKSIKQDSIKQKLTLMFARMESKLQAAMNSAFIDALGDYSYKIPLKVRVARNEIANRSNMVLERLKFDIQTSLNRKIDIQSSNDKILTLVNAIFEAFKYRLDFISSTEITRARNLGLIYKAIEDGVLKAKLSVKIDTCEKCKSNSIDSIHLQNYTLYNVPPHHNSCKCGLVVTEVNNG